MQDQKKIPRWDERIRVDACLGRSKQHAANVALILNLQTGHVSPQHHVVFDDNFETVQSLRDGVEPTRCRWLVEYERECHADNDGSIVDGAKVWTDSELESIILFEVPKEKHQEVKEQLDPIDPSTINFNQEDSSHAPILLQHNSNLSTKDLINSQEDDMLHATNDNDHEQSSRVPKFTPVNINTIGLRRSPQIAALKAKDTSLNNVGFIQATTLSEGETTALEGVDPLQETFTCKEAMNSPHEKDFLKAVHEETSTHALKNHWRRCLKDDIPLHQNLRSAWYFRIKKNRSTREIIKFKARFCADGSRQTLGVYFSLKVMLQ